MTRRIAIAAALAGLLLALAAAAAADVALKVTPGAGGRATAFAISFTSPTRTGVVGSKRLQDELVADSRSVSGGCRSSVQKMLPSFRAGQHVRVALTAANWCAGTFHGRLVQLESLVCPPGAMCPMYIRQRTLGTFSFAVH